MLLVLSLISCQENLDMNDMDAKSKLVIYCFPCDTDTIFMQISQSIPVNSCKSTSLNIQNITCIINGINMPIGYKGNGKDKLNSGIYYITGKFCSGDTIHLQINTKEHTPITASAILPDKPIITSLDIDTLCIKGEWFTQLRMGFHNSSDKAYYAIRIIGMEVTKEYTRENIQYIDNNEEPLLNNYSKGNVDFGTSNEYYHHMYIFDNSQIIDNTYILHLNVPYCNYIPCYKVQLFRITHDYYKFLKSINDINNNNLSNYGMSFITPTFSNIKNGIGILGAYRMQESQWIGNISIERKIHKKYLK